MHKSLKVVLDADDVLYQCNQTAIQLLNEEYGTNYTLQDINKWGLTNTLLDKRLKYFDNPEFIRKIKVMDGSKEFIKELSKIAEIFICTSVKPQCASERYNAIVRDFPEIKHENIMIGSRKDLITADIMLDDALHNLLNARVDYPVLFQRPWNLENNSVLSVSGYKEFINLVLKIKLNYFEHTDKYQVISVIGPSGAGKNELVLNLLKDDRFQRIKSYSTKPSKSHYYIDKDDFEKERSSFMETSIYLGEYYGIKKDEIQKIIDNGKIPIAIVDINGAMTINSLYDSLNVFVKASKEQCVERIIADDYLTKEQKVKRIVSIDTENRNENLCDVTVTEDNYDEIIRMIIQ